MSVSAATIASFCPDQSGWQNGAAHSGVLTVIWEVQKPVLTPGRTACGIFSLDFATDGKGCFLLPGKTSSCQ